MQRYSINPQLPECKLDLLKSGRGDRAPPPLSADCPCVGDGGGVAVTKC